LICFDLRFNAQIYFSIFHKVKVKVKKLSYSFDIKKIIYLPPAAETENDKKLIQEKSYWNCFMLNLTKVFGKTQFGTVL